MCANQVLTLVNQNVLKTVLPDEFSVGSYHNQTMVVTKGNSVICNSKGWDSAMSAARWPLPFSQLFLCTICLCYSQPHLSSFAFPASWDVGDTCYSAHNLSHTTLAHAVSVMNLEALSMPCRASGTGLPVLCS